MKKPGYKTTEFWLSVIAAFAGLFMASGILGDGSSAERVVGIIVSGLAALGYGPVRAFTKSSENKVESAKELAKAPLK